ncbi:MAG TPA: L-aspartate oxidase [Humibacter sp.]|nr:L-aspartate oxidase [Humibacter sp.]
MLAGVSRPRVIVVGSGIAGLTAALRASTFADVTVVTKAALPESNTLYAQGGIAAALFDDDSAELHIADTLHAGAGLSDEDAVRILCTEGPGLVRELIGFGVPFDRDGRDLARGLEAAHSRARVLHAGGDATGRAIELALAARLRASGVRVIEHAMLTDLVMDDDRVTGVRTFDDHVFTTLAAEAVILATGGAGRLYAHTTNPAVATGDGVAAAWRAGAELADLEFYQFHPTTLAIPGGKLVSEAVRGEGAVLLDAAGERFMTRVHPDAELAPRDVVARAIAATMAGQGGSPVLLDATHLGRGFLAKRFPTIQAATRAGGFDWAREPIPVTPAAHYWMGGVKTDAWARTSLPGLYAVGEVACTGAQGANRLASNSLLEGLVFAARAVDALRVADLVCSSADDGAVEAGPARPDGDRDGLPEVRSATGDLGDLVRETMWRNVGVERDGDGLRTALERVDALARSAHAPTTLQEHEDRNLLTLGMLVTRGALARQESRGAHYRSDFPETAETAVHSVVALNLVAPSDDDQIFAREGLAGKAVAAC